MSIRARNLLLTVLPGIVLASVLGAGSARGQAPPPPPPPRPLEVSPTAELGQPVPLASPPAAPAPVLAPPPPGLDYLEPAPPPPPAPSATLAPAVPATPSDPWGPYAPPASVQPGLFLNAEIEYLFPVLQGRVGSGTAVDPTSPLPSSNLNSTVAPWLEVGYVFGPQFGLVAGNYRFFSTDGTTNVTTADLPAQVHSRLSINMGDLDFGTLPCSFAPRWTWQGRVGIRWADTFYQTQLQNAFSFQQESNLFYGAGPHGRIDVNRQFGLLPGLSFFGRADGAFLFGQVRQHYIADLDTPFGTVNNGTVMQSRTQTVPIILFQAGLQYTPLSATYLHFTLGYQYEHWWYVGRIGDDPANGNFNHTKGDFGAQGVFLRGQFDF